MYSVNQAERADRPKTSMGHRRRADNPPRSEPQQVHEANAYRDEESIGRPISRVGFSPESSYRYSHDEYSRQMSPDNEHQAVNSPCNSPEILYQDEEYFARQKAAHKPIQPNVDRLIVSPTSPTELSPKHTKGHMIIGQSSDVLRESPYNHQHSPYQLGQFLQQSSVGSKQMVPYMRPTSCENINVSPLQRDEAQIQGNDLHHEHGYGQGSKTLMSENYYPQAGDDYQPHFSESPQNRNSPYKDYRTSPEYRESPYSVSPTNRGFYSGSPDSQSRPPPAPRPKSSRPRTARKKSARVRHQHRYEEQGTSPPQHCDTSSILNAGDPYGRPSSSLSPYKPLPAIGVSTPRSPEKAERQHESNNAPYIDGNYKKADSIQRDTQHLGHEQKFNSVDDHGDNFAAEDIQGTNHRDNEHFTNMAIPSMDVLTSFPQHLSNEIYKLSVENYNRNSSGIMNSEYNEKPEGHGYMEYNEMLKTETPLDYLHKLPEEPNKGQDRMLLAIKLPNGKRIQRYFNPSDILESVLHFAENENMMKYEDYHLVCNAPRILFEDLSLSLQDTHIKDKTLLYLEEKN